MKINISKSTTKVVGCVRLSSHAFERLEEIVKKEGVSKQEVIRAILDQVIDSVE